MAAAGHVPHQKCSARGGVGKVSNYINMLPVGYVLLRMHIKQKIKAYSCQNESCLQNL